MPQGTPEWILYSSLAFYSGFVSGSCNEFSRTLRFPVYNQTQDVVRGKSDLNGKIYAPADFFHQCGSNDVL